VSKLEKLLPLLEPENLSKLASPKALSAGQELFKNKSVSDLVVDDGKVKGKVKGSHPVPHSTSIKRGYSDGKYFIDASCSCPTFNDGWEKVCHHAVAIALALRAEYQGGGELTMTTNPWVADLDSGATLRRYQLEPRRGIWQVQVFQSGSSRRGSGNMLSPADRLIQSFIEQEIDETESGAHVLEDAAIAGMLYFARDSNVSVKGIGKVSFPETPLLLRVQAESREKDARVELHAFLECTESERSFEVDSGRLIIGAPTWFLWPETGELFTVKDAPPWVLEAVAKQPRIVMDSRVGAEQMDEISDKLQSIGVPRQDLHALASDSRDIDLIIATIEGGSNKIRVNIAARYGNVTVDITGRDPETARHSIKVDKQSITFYRDIAGEAAARKHLLDGKLKWDLTERAFCARDDDAIEFMIAGIPLMPEEWEKRVPKMPKVRSKSPGTRVSVKSKGGSVLDVHAVVNVDGEEDLISFRDLLRWLHDGRRWITLADGSVAKLDTKILQPIADAAGHLQFDKAGHTEISTLELGTLARLLQEVPSAEVAAEVKKLMKNMTGERAARAPRKAKALNAKLRPYQRSGYAWLWQLHENQMTGILADDMGLGKTVQALALLTKAKEVEGDMPSLIVGPTSVLGVWRGEVRKFSPSLSVLVWHGSDRGENRRLLKKSDIVVTSYALLRRDIEELKKIRFRYVILDEAQYIKNWTTSTAKSAKQLKADHRLALSGTPVENHLVDLWAIYDFLAPGFLGKLSEFQRDYVRPIEAGDSSALDALRARVRPFIMRRKKEDVASELPPKIEQTIFVQFSKTQLGLYNRILKAARSEIDVKLDDVGIEKSQMTILAALTRLRQVATDPRLLGLPEGSPVPPSAKMEAFKELISDVVGSGRKALVFSQFVKMQKLICQELDEMEIEYLHLHGGTKNRDEMVARFQRDDGPPIFVISLKAGGSGLTLTQADTVIHYDPWWNPAVEDQATDRAHRIGQDKSVNVYRLVVEHTVEQGMVELGAEKRRVADSAIGRDAAVGKKLTMEDVQKLLEKPVGGAAAWDSV
jgi:superfamily II DNA or RNA helicase